jgi:hypothetical protein
VERLRGATPWEPAVAAESLSSSKLALSPGQPEPEAGTMKGSGPPPATERPTGSLKSPLTKQARVAIRVAPATVPGNPPGVRESPRQFSSYQMAAVVAPVCAAALRQWIDDSLQLCMHANAVFLCERLYYASPTEEVSSRAGDRSAAVQSGMQCRVAYFRCSARICSGYAIFATTRRFARTLS